MHCNPVSNRTKSTDQMPITYTVGGVGEHFESCDRIRLQRTVEDEEAGKRQLALYFVPRHVVDLWSLLDKGGRTQCFNTHPVSAQRSCFFPGQRKNAATSSCEILECIVVTFRYNVEHEFDCFRSSFCRDENPPIWQRRDGGHPFEGRRELESPSNGYDRAMGSGGGCRGDLPAFRDLPIQRLQRRALHRVADNSTVVQLNQGMCGRQTKSRFPCGFLHVD